MHNDHIQSRMAEALKLTRAGRILEATKLIQQTLNNTPPTYKTTVTPVDPVDAEFHVVDETPQPQPDIPFGKQFSAWKPLVEHLRTATQDTPAHTPGKFIDCTYTGSSGTHAYKLYIPARFTGQPLPLLIMLHGCTQTPVDFATGTAMNVLAEKELFLVAYPAQTASANSSKCWNWFQPANQQRGTGEPALIAGLTRQIMDKYPVDASRVYIAGLSSGGAMAATMAATYPDLYAAVGVHSGIAHASAQDLPSALKAMQQGASRQVRPLAKAIPLIVFQGDSDTTVAPANADRVLDQWLPATTHKVIVEPGQVSGGRTYTRSIYTNPTGYTIAEKWIIHQAGHAWSGGSSNGSFTDPKGPDASAAMTRFFNDHPRPVGV